ncbi:hypothetical protein Tco_1308216 [Tanacetum coccineum]
MTVRPTLMPLLESQAYVTKLGDGRVPSIGSSTVSPVEEVARDDEGKEETWLTWPVEPGTGDVAGLLLAGFMRIKDLD